ncbi:VOC family protein [Aldersonia kunmingensis]|uniref:VOC family protein n=1 Tax=Aldersonia kunmingensis TaxID=408066 RepID=UPI00082A04CB|nr:VOC family protein [Aldersonia kunmingensis]
MTRPAIELDYAVLDCPDPIALAEFYAQLLGWEIVRADEEWVVAQAPGNVARLAFQLAPDFEPVDWPSESVHSHLDFIVDDPAAAESWAVGLGAELVDDALEHPGFRVFRDPAGHYFCLCLRDAAE